MKIDCTITEQIQRDFSTLWKCEQRGETVEISTPYLLPDSTLLTVMLKVVGERCIVCDGGAVWEAIAEYSAVPADEIIPALREMARHFRIREGELLEHPLFFNECNDLKLVSSLVFDIANFAIAATSALVSASTDDIAVDVEHRFETKAENYIKTAAHDFRVMPRSEVIEVPGVKFNAVLKRDGFVWLVSYVNGSTLTHFRRSLCDTLVTFRHANESTLHDRIRATIPIVNNEATGYDPDKLALHFDDLKEETDDRIVRWTEKEHLDEILHSA